MLRPPAVTFSILGQLRCWRPARFSGVIPEIVEIEGGGPQPRFGITGADNRKEVTAANVILATGKGARR